MPNTSRAFESPKRLAISINREDGSRDASMYKINEMAMQPLTTKCGDNEIPLDSIKTFCKIDYKHEFINILGFQGERVSNFLCYYNVLTYTPTFNESLLRRMGIVWQMRLQPISQDLAIIL